MSDRCRLLLAVAVLALAGASPLHAQATFKIIVNPSTPGNTVKKAVLADIFLGKVARWGDGSRIAPVDQSVQSPLRQAFARDVLGQPVAAVMNYWAKQITSGGVRPPAVTDKDDDVIAFVASTPGGIGYVAEAAVLPATVKQLKIE